MFPATHKKRDVRSRRPVHQLGSAAERLDSSPAEAVPHSAIFDALAGDTPFRDMIIVDAVASPLAIFEALRTVTLRDMKLAWFLGELRYLPARLIARPRAGDSTKPFLASLLDGGTVILADNTPREIVLGSAGVWHRLVDQAPVHLVDKESFHAFSDPAYEKLIMSLRVEASGRVGHRRIVLEHATVPLSPDAARRFTPYWRLIKPTGAFVSRQLLKAIGQRAEGR